MPEIAISCDPSNLIITIIIILIAVIIILSLLPLLKT